jgi:hypothetical protein
MHNPYSTNPNKLDQALNRIPAWLKLVLGAMILGLLFFGIHAFTSNVMDHTPQAQKPIQTQESEAVAKQQP